MILKRQLSLISLVILLLPVLVWFFLLRVDSLLRDNVSASQVRLLENLGQSLLQSPDLRDRLKNTANGLFIHDLGKSVIQLDGYRDDWPPELAQQLLPGKAHRIYLARSGRQLLLRLDVADDSINFSVPGKAWGDSLQLTLGHRSGFYQYRLRWEGRGMQQKAVAEGNIRYAMMDFPGEQGYTLEAALPWPDNFSSLKIHLFDQADDAVMLDESYPVLSYDRNLAFRLQAFSEAGSRLWLCQKDGFILAASEMQSGDQAGVVDAPWYLAWFYRLLSTDMKTGSTLRSSFRLALPDLEGRDSRMDWHLDPASGLLMSRGSRKLSDEGETLAVLVLERKNDPTLLLAGNAMLELMLASLLVFLAGMAVLIFYAGHLSLRIRRLRENVDEAWSERKGLQHDFQASKRHDEIGDLSRSYAAMLEQISRHTRYLKTLPQSLSHELKTPIAVVRSSLENLEMCKDLDEGRIFIHRASEGLGKLSRILAAMMEANQLESSLATEDREALNMSHYLASYLETYRSTCSDCCIESQVDEEQDLYVLASADRLSQLLDKLLDNAIGFHAEGSCIRVLLDASDGKVLVSVENEGPLLPVELSESIFESLVSARKTGSGQATPHLGLGLFIARLIAEFHQGELRAENLESGLGVRFQLCLPAL